VQQAPPSPTPSPTPIPCKSTGQVCGSPSQCCGDQCGPSFNDRATDVCCLGPGQRCSASNDLCCTGSTFGCDCGPNGDQCCGPSP
jgi:hypothetical protein